MATKRTTRELNQMQQSADMQMDILILKRVMDLPDHDDNGLVSKVKGYAKDLSWDGSSGMALYEKTATVMMSDGFGYPRDAFPAVYLDILEERNRLMSQNEEAFDELDARTEERNAWAVGQQYTEVDRDYQPAGVHAEGLEQLSEQQALADQRMGGILQRLAKRAMDKVVDTMVAFDSSIDAVAAKSQSMWSSVTNAIKSKKTKLAALAATAIVAAGLTGNPAQAADIPQADAPTTHAEMMQSMHEARADFMEEQIKQEAKDKFSSHLQSLKAEAVADFSEGLDQAIEQAERDFDYSYNILHNPSFQDAALSQPDIQDVLMENESIKSVVKYSPVTQKIMDDMQYDDAVMEKILKDDEIKHQVTKMPVYKRMVSGELGVNETSLDDDAFMRRTIDMPGVKDMVLKNDLVKMSMMMDEEIQEIVLKEPAVREMAFSAPETKKRVLETSGIDRVLDTPEMEERVMRDIGKEMSLNMPGVEKAPEIVHMPEKEQAPRLNITQAELDQLASPSSAKSPALDLPEQKEHKLNLPEQKERELVHLSPPKERHFNADFLKMMEADTITYAELEEQMFDSDVYTSVNIGPSPTSNMDASIDAHSIKFMVEREGVDFSQYLGEIEANGSPELVSTMKHLVETADMEWDTSGYSKEKDPNHFVVKHHADKEKSVAEDKDAAPSMG